MSSTTFSFLKGLSKQTFQNKQPPSKSAIEMKSKSKGEQCLMIHTNQKKNISQSHSISSPPDSPQTSSFGFQVDKSKDFTKLFPPSLSFQNICSNPSLPNFHADFNKGSPIEKRKNFFGFTRKQKPKQILSLFEHNSEIEDCSQEKSFEVFSSQNLDKQSSNDFETIPPSSSKSSFMLPFHRKRSLSDYVNNIPRIHPQSNKPAFFIHSFQTPMKFVFDFSSIPSFETEISSEYDTNYNETVQATGNLIKESNEMLNKIIMNEQIWKEKINKFKEQITLAHAQSLRNKEFLISARINHENRVNSVYQSFLQIFLYFLHLWRIFMTSMRNKKLE